MATFTSNATSDERLEGAKQKAAVACDKAKRIDTLPLWEECVLLISKWAMVAESEENTNIKNNAVAPMNQFQAGYTLP